MRAVLKLLIVFIVAYLVLPFVPWYFIAVIPWLVSVVLKGNYFSGFISGFFGIALVWAFEGVKIHLKTEGVLTQKMAVLFGLPDEGLLFVICALVGGLVGGFGAMLGVSTRNLFKRKKKGLYYR